LFRHGTVSFNGVKALRATSNLVERNSHTETLTKV
jgi:hypothetical protein